MQIRFPNEKFYSTKLSFLFFIHQLLPLYEFCHWCLVLQSLQIEHRSLNLLWYQSHYRYFQFVSLATSILGPFVAIVSYFFLFSWFAAITCYFAYFHWFSNDNLPWCISVFVCFIHCYLYEWSSIRAFLRQPWVMLVPFPFDGMEYRPWRRTIMRLD